MKTTNYGLLQINSTLSEFAGKHLPQKISYAIVKNISRVETNIQIYRGTFEKLCNDYEADILKDENGKRKTYTNGVPQLKEEKKGAFETELRELLDVEIDIDLHTIPEGLFDYDDAGRYDPMSPQEIMRLKEIMCTAE